MYNTLDLKLPVGYGPTLVDTCLGKDNLGVIVNRIIPEEISAMEMMSDQRLLCCYFMKQDEFNMFDTLPRRRKYPVHIYDGEHSAENFWNDFVWREFENRIEHLKDIKRETMHDALVSGVWDEVEYRTVLYVITDVEQMLLDKYKDSFKSLLIRGHEYGMYFLLVGDNGKFKYWMSDHVVDSMLRITRRVQDGTDMVTVLPSRKIRVCD